MSRSSLDPIMNSKFPHFLLIDLLPWNWYGYGHCILMQINKIRVGIRNWVTRNWWLWLGELQPPKVSKHIGNQPFSSNFIFFISAFCPEKYPYSTSFGRICCQEKPDRDAFLNEFCRKDQVGTCQAFNVNQKFRCGNHQSVEENCKYIYLFTYV